MQVKYRIINVDAAQHSIVVRYFTDTITEDMLASSKDVDGVIERTSDGYPVKCQTDYNINVWKTDPSPTQEDIKKLAGIGQTSYGEEMSNHGTNLGAIQREKNIQPGTDEWFRLWFSKPTLTGETPYDK